MSRFFYSIDQEEREASIIRLLFFQLLPIGILLITFFIYEQEVEERDLTERMNLLDESHLEELDSQLKNLGSSRSLIFEDKEKVDYLFKKVSEETGFKLDEIKSYSKMVEEGIIPTDYKIRITGDAYDFPVWLKRIHNQRVLTMFNKIELNILEPKTAIISIEIRFFRPDIPSSKWIESIEATDLQREVLTKGWLLWNWKYYQSQEKALSKESRRLYNQLINRLPPVLIALRHKRGTYNWPKD